MKRQVYPGRIVDLWLEEVELPNGHRVSLEVIHHPGASAVVALDDERQVTLVRQFRHAAGGFIVELPAGKLDRGEPPAQCAARELREETGLVAGELIELGSIVTTPGFCDERIYLFLARQLSEAAQELGTDEVLTVFRVPLARALEMIRSGEIEDAKSIAGLHLAAAYLSFH
ncbi:MAG TPA: NUDIX hydrolase [Terriglobales bacterium]|nr:NUDIX hydrolase [Terriglobales bacterium]